MPATAEPEDKEIIEQFLFRPAWRGLEGLPILEVLTMSRTVKAFCLGAAVCAAGLLAVSAQEARAQKQDIKGGIEGKIAKVDVENKTLTIITAQGRQHTYTV